MYQRLRESCSHSALKTDVKVEVIIKTNTQGSGKHKTR